MHILRLDREDAATARAMHATERASVAVEFPDSPPWSEHVFVVRVTGRPPVVRANEAWYIPGEDRGSVAGWYRLVLPDLENRDRAELDVTVHPAARGRGLGTALLRHATGRAAANGRAHLDGTVRQGSAGEAFARRAGSSFGLAEVLRVLDVTSVPAGHFTRCREAAAKAATEYSLVSWAGRTPDEHVNGMAAMLTAMNDAPNRPDAEPDIWDEQRVRERYDARTAAFGARAYVIAAIHDGTGEMVAMSELRVDRDVPDWGFQGNTVVARPHRGHRLGLLVKAAMLELLTDAEPAVRKLATFNAAVNDHMIAINAELGFTACGSPYLETSLRV
jgi:GNAT superfamily N-acetyltransferase